MTSHSGSGGEPSFCGNCGASMLPGSAVCAVCGQPAPAGQSGPPRDYIPYCRRCGVGVPWGMGHVCRRCGVAPLCELHFRATEQLCFDCAPEYAPGLDLGRGEAGRLACGRCGATAETDAEFCHNCGARLSGMTGSAGHSGSVGYADSVEYMGFWIRLAAFIIDRIFTYLVAALIATIIGISTTAGEPAPLPESEIEFTLESINTSFLLLVWGVSVVYGVVLTSIRGQTLGKMLLRIQVVDAHGNTPPWYRVALREVVGKFLSELLLYMGYLWIIFDSRKRGWHDYLGGTFVVRKRRDGGMGSRGF